MSDMQTILRNLPLHPEGRKLLRPSIRVSAIGQNLAASLDGEPRPEPRTASGSERRSDDRAQMDFPNALNSDFEHSQAVHALVEEARVSAYRNGFQDGTAATQEGLERRAAQLALALSEKRIQKVCEDAKRDAEAAGQVMHAELTARRDAYAKLLASLTSELEKCLKDLEPQMLEIAFAAAMKLLGTAAVTADGMQRLIANARESWRLSSEPKVHLHPDDYDVLQADATTHASCEAAMTYLVSDPGVVLGGCILRNHDGALDARLEVQVAALKQAILDTRSARKQPGAVLVEGNAT